MNPKFFAILLSAVLFQTTAHATEFGDAYGNTIYEIVDKTQECGHSTVEGGDYVRVLSSGESFTLNYPSQPNGGYLSYKYYSVARYGVVSATTVGVDRTYRSSRIFVARESRRPPYSANGPITMTEESFVLDRGGLMTYVKIVDGQEQLRCRYQKL